MPLSPGTRLGPYEIIAKLGEGGMGEVYRGRDTRLNRDVALKVLPELFAADRDRMARFEREAQTLAALNHPNIGQIYGLETGALVMELVDGDDLTQIIARGPVPIAEALAIARQIVDAVEAAHEAGIVHRDLKPANVKVRPDGTVKVLDFGLAKAIEPAAGAADPLNSPTLSVRGTQIGTVLGTAAYMAPEQARGKAVDRRADIWAFGVILFEMLTGGRAFDGESVSDVLAAVLRQDVDLSLLPADTPRPVRRLLRRCLERDPRKRLSAIGDARLEIDEIEADPAPAAAATPARRRVMSPLIAAAGGMVLTAVAALVIWPIVSRPRAGALTRLSILPPAGQQLRPDSSTVALSPDGTMVAFQVGTVAIDTELWVRPLDSNVARRLDDARGAAFPFWSPDSRRIGFSSVGDRRLKTIAASGGRAEVVADTAMTRGAVWTPSNVILMSGISGPLLQVPATGGTITSATTLDASRGEQGHRFPTLLPDGDHFLYVALPGKEGKFDVFAGALSNPSSGARVFVGAFDAAPVYAEPGYLLYSRQGVLAAVPFDPKALETTGDPILLGDEPSHILDAAIAYTAARSVSVSATGSLAYYSSPSDHTVARWYDATGAQAGTLNLPPAHYDSVRISPDGSQAAAVRSLSASSSALMLVDLARGTTTPLSTGPGRNDSPVWSPDGTRVVFASDRSGLQQFFSKTVNDAQPEQEIYTSDRIFKSPISFTPDGRTIVFNVVEQTTGQDILMVDASGSGQATLVLQTPQRDLNGSVSPDGRWLAYESESGGTLEIWVQPFPGPGRRVQISESGGSQAWWTADGRHLLWAANDFRSLWRAEIVPGATFGVRPPVKIATLPPGIQSIDARPDRQGFLAIVPARTGTGSITVVQNWLRALDAKR